MGKRHMEIYLIEDDPDDMKMIGNRLNDYARNGYNCDDYTFEVKPLEGTDEQIYCDKNMKFYNMDIIARIENIQSMVRQQEHEMGLLLDVLLAKEEIESARGNYYPVSQIAREIYSKFHEQMPIYIVTSLPMFSGQSDIIMGVDLKECFIPKYIFEHWADKDAKVMFDYYRDWAKDR